MDNINNLIRQTTDIDVPGAAQKNLKDTDVVQIWDEASSFIERFMTNTKGVSIPGFGTFTFIQKKIDIGNNKIIRVQRPVFVLSEKFAQTHGLNYTKYPVAGNIPVHPLNYVAIAQETAFTRDDVEQCIKHILQVMNRSVQSRKNVEFKFNGIGKLQIRDSKVKMKFFKEFINNFEESGKIIADMQNRPNTCDSVMSRNEVARHSRNTCLLPRLNSRIGAISVLDNNGFNNNSNNNNNNNVMDTIQEDFDTEGEELLHIKSLYQDGEENTEEQQLQIPTASYYSPEESDLQETNNINPNQSIEINESLMPQISNRPATTSGGLVGYRIPTLFSSKSLSALNHKQMLEQQNPSLNQNEFEALRNTLGYENSDINSNESHGHTNLIQKRPDTTSIVLNRPSSSRLLNNLVPKQKPTSPCGHYNAGQELCYLCHQRTRRNVPVYLHEEIRQKDLEETQVLMQYQSMKDLDKQLRDEEKRNLQRLDRAKVDAFNLGVSDAVRQKKAERPKTSDMGRSFVFRKRARTPPKAYRQAELSDFLSKQMEFRQKEALINRQESNYIEKMEQMKLAEDLASQREAYLKMKYQRQVDLKHALDTQVKNKPAALPKVLPDSEVFGRHDMKNEKISKMKQKEIEQHHYNREKIEQTKRHQLLEQLREQEIDSENNEKLREELRIDRAQRFTRMVDMRKNLENNWNKSNYEKKLRDIDEKGHRLAHDGTLVHEQCDKYKRCGQCQKDVKNCGESNIWADTRYVAGTRLIA